MDIFVNGVHIWRYPMQGESDIAGGEVPRESFGSTSFALMEINLP
jgi:hypothetical protein